MKKDKADFYHTHISLSLVAAISAAAILYDSAQVLACAETSALLTPTPLPTLLPFGMYLTGIVSDDH